MKKLKLIIVVICVPVLALFLLGAECGVVPARTPVRTVESLPDYYIIFKFDGVEMDFKKGFTNVEVNAFANVFDSEYTFFFATSEVVQFNPNGYFIYFVVNGIDDGEYTLDYIEYQGKKVDPIYGSSEGSIKITEYGDVSGVIEGTFSATVADNGTTKDITEGKFKVKRIQDDKFSP